MGWLEMAWATPRTWSAGELVTAANMNTYVSDLLTLLKTPITDGGRLRFPTITQTTTTAGYSATVDDDIVVVKAGRVDVLLATATASSTGREVRIKSLSTEELIVYGADVTIDGATSTVLGTGRGSIRQQYDSLTFFRAGATCWLIV